LKASQNSMALRNILKSDWLSDVIIGVYAKTTHQRYSSKPSAR